MKITACNKTIDKLLKAAKGWRTKEGRDIFVNLLMRYELSKIK